MSSPSLRPLFSTLFAMSAVIVSGLSQQPTMCIKRAFPELGVSCASMAHIGINDEVHQAQRINKNLHA